MKKYLCYTRKYELIGANMMIKRKKILGKWWNQINEKWRKNENSRERHERVEDEMDDIF